MSNTLLFSSSLGQTYFSVFGNPIINQLDPGVNKAITSVVKFYKQKESDKLEKKKKDKPVSSVQFWSIFILLIINEYTIGKPIKEDNSELEKTLSVVEVTEIPQHKLDNYIN
jgi:hypothetical protein